MNYADRVKRAAHNLDELIIDGLSQKTPEIEEDLALVLTNEIGRIHDIGKELDEIPRAKDEGELREIASFPYPHKVDRNRMRLVMYDKPCPSGDGSGEYIIWTEIREDDHDGFREPTRNWGIFNGYHDVATRNTVYYDTLDKFSFKCAAMVRPFVEKDRRNYRRAN